VITIWFSLTRAGDACACGCPLDGSSMELTTNMEPLVMREPSWFDFSASSL
jgi:hypothetical protein